MPPASRRALLAFFAGAVIVLASVVAARRAPAWRWNGPERSASAPIVQLRRVAAGLGQITGITNAGDARLFVTIQNGRVLILNGGVAAATPFLDVAPGLLLRRARAALRRVSSQLFAEPLLLRQLHQHRRRHGHRALPDLASDPNLADPASGVILLTIAQPFPNHNGGQLQFGPDGYLYIGMGDGGSANDPMCNAQRDDSLLGKMLRIDVDQNVNSPPFYGIPPDNPFAAPGGPLDEIWAKGLRNPWRFSFDRVTGDLYIADVGQGEREEIDFQPRASAGGENYGWKIMEGTLCGGGGTSGCPGGRPGLQRGRPRPPDVRVRATPKAAR